MATGGHKQGKGPNHHNPKPKVVVTKHHVKTIERTRVIKEVVEVDTRRQVWPAKSKQEGKSKYPHHNPTSTKTKPQTQHRPPSSKKQHYGSRPSSRQHNSNNTTVTGNFQISINSYPVQQHHQYQGRHHQPCTRGRGRGRGNPHVQ